MGGEEEIPAEEVPAEPAPEMGGEEEVEVAAEPEGEEGADDLLNKELQKMVGKLTNKVREVDLTPDQAKGFMNSILSAFESEMSDIDVDERKEMSDKIMKPAEEGGEGGEEVAAEFEASEEVPAEEAPVEENICSECGTFEAYHKSRGYESLDECSPLETGNLISGYATAYNDGMNDGDFEGVAKYITPEVNEELMEYGLNEYVSEIDPYVQKLNEKADFGSVDVADENNQISENGEEETEETPEVEAGEIEDVASELENALDTPAEETPEIEVTPEVEVPSDVSVDFAPAGEVMDAGMPSVDGAKTKSVEVDLNTNKVNLTVTEGEEKKELTLENKVRSYVRTKLQEMIAGKKTTINESAKPKSKTLQALDKMIEDQYKKYLEKK